MLQIKSMNTPGEIALRWMSQNTIYCKSTLAQVFNDQVPSDWRQYRPRSKSPYGVPGPWWVWWYITVMFSGRHGVPNHRQIVYLFKSSSNLTIMKISKSRYLAESLHKRASDVDSVSMHIFTKQQPFLKRDNTTRIILDIGAANERRGCIVTSSLIGCAHTQNDPCTSMQ